MKYLRPSKKIVIMLGCAALILLSFFYFVFANIRDKNIHAATLLRDVSLEVAKQQDMIGLKRTIENTSSDIVRVNNSIIPIDGDVQFIEDLESRARVDGLSVTIDSLTFDNTLLAASPDVTMFKVKAEVKGSWAGVYRFLGELESLPFKLKINTFNLVNTSANSTQSTSKTPKFSSTWQGNFEIIVLKYK